MNLENFKGVSSCVCSAIGLAIPYSFVSGAAFLGSGRATLRLFHTCSASTESSWQTEVLPIKCGNVGPGLK